MPLCHDRYNLSRDLNQNIKYLWNRLLQLTLSNHKSRMGLLTKGFHFLGINFEVSRNPQRKLQVATLKIHSRTCRRALDKVQAMRESAVNPAKIQRYLANWAAWWHSITKLSKIELIFRWVKYTEPYQQSLVWFGRGLLLGSPNYSKCWV